MSAAWTAGYVSDVAYTLGFYRELAPEFLNYVCLTNGVEGLKRGRRLRYCELGCGRGYGTTLLAAANPDIDFVGIDFNPTHIGEARTLAADADIANVRFVEAGFADAAADAGLGEFDVATLHGVYTWVDRQVRRDIVDFLRTRLVPGGIAFVSYNTLPGWSATVPIQKLLMEFGGRSSGDSLARMRAARASLMKLVQSGAGYVNQNPVVKARIEGLGSQDIHYLVHEFLHRAWEPIYVTEALGDFAEAKLSFVGSATLPENRLKLSVPQEMVAMVNDAPDLPLRELLKDYAINKQFRRDVYVKGPIRISGAEQEKRWNRLIFRRLGVRGEPPEVWRIPAGEARLKPELVKAVTARLRDGSASGQQIMQSVTDAKFSGEDAFLCVELLVSAGMVEVSRADQGGTDRAASRRLNAAVFARAQVDDTHRFLAAPAIGSAIGSNVFDRLVAPLIVEDAGADAAAVVERLFAMMEKDNRTISRDGRTLTRDDSEEVAKMVANIKEKVLPVWRDLGVVD